jgi:ubiquinone/menaquinone biosynthesis C-methylase UbiE/uncharacterized protein YbaR (Trm112 family)
VKVFRNLEEKGMRSPVKLSEAVRENLRCPICGTALAQKDAEFVCVNSHCRTSFPIVDGIPIILNEAASIFSISDFVAQRQATMKVSQSRIKKALSRFLPNIDANLKAQRNYRELAQQLLQRSPNPIVLVIGCGNLGEGLSVLLEYTSIELVDSDVSLGGRTAIVCDAHDLPFPANYFDGVIIQAVLEHVVDPYRCVEEIHRVLKEEGLIYAEIPFMQQVHMGQYDFTRFTHLGQRRLFRSFEEIGSGAVGGPGMALAWSYQYFLLSFSQSKIARDFVKIFTRLTSFYLKYFDYYLQQKPGAFDSASGYYFLGRKSNSVLSDRELIKLYKGAI